MRYVHIRLDLEDPDVLKEFSHDMNSFRSDINAKAGSIHVDAKSLLAIMALGKPELEISIVSADKDEVDRFYEVINKYGI